MHHSVGNLFLELPGFCLGLISGVQKILCEVAFGLHLLHVRILFLRQDIRFDQPAPGHLAQLRRVLAVLPRGGGKVLLA